MRAYLDTYIISAGTLPKKRLVTNMNSLVAVASVGSATFLTSPTAQRELERISDPSQRALALQTVKKLPIMQWSAGPFAFSYR